MDGRRSLTTVQAAVAAGEFKRALQILNATGAASSDASWSVQRAELLALTGDLEAALSLGKRLLRQDVGADAKARVHLLISAVKFARGEFDGSVSHTAQALLHANAGSDASVLARAHLYNLEVCAETGLEEQFLSQIAEVRKAVARTADPHLIVQLRLVFAKVEASRRSLVEARRHLQETDTLLSSAPNLWLRARKHLGLAVIDTLEGSVSSAVDHALSAIALARRSGHVRTELAGLINLSHALQARGDLVEARERVDHVLRSVGDDVKYRIAALDSLANLLRLSGQPGDAMRTLQEVDGLLAGSAGKFTSSWARFSLAETYAWILLDLGQSDKAVHPLRRTLGSAEKHGVWRPRLRIAQLAAEAANQSWAEVSSLYSKLADEQLSLDAQARVFATLAASPVSAPRREALIERSRRIAAATGSAPLLEECSRQARAGPDPAPPAESDAAYLLDAAATLPDVAGYPLLLAQEALALVTATGCALSAAVIARSEAAARVVATHGWTEKDAVRTARRGSPAVSIDCGTFRHERIELLVVPQDDLERQTTWVSIRKILGAALALENYRQDEKARGALWPAEPLAGDAQAVWSSEAVSEVLKIGRKVAPSDVTILITGETGTGKEVMARAIHQASNRAGKTFLPFNCTAAPRELFESQLFGYRRGAFTGADAGFTGVIRAAEGGTLFLDEIGDVPLEVQPKLLRFLETREIHAIGEAHPARVDVRIIAATNADLPALMASGRFREDLYYRLNIIPLRLPPLRERREEIPALVHHYIAKYAIDQQKGPLTLTDETLEYLLLFNWPGNIRQLANEVRRMVALADPGSRLTPDHLSAEIRAARKTVPAAPASSDPGLGIPLEGPLSGAVDRLERAMIEAALKRADGRLEEAARMLGISRKGLFLKRRRLGLYAPGDDEEESSAAGASLTPDIEEPDLAGSE